MIKRPTEERQDQMSDSSTTQRFTQGERESESFQQENEGVQRMEIDEGVSRYDEEITLLAKYFQTNLQLGFHKTKTSMSEIDHEKDASNLSDDDNPMIVLQKLEKCLTRMRLKGRLVERSDNQIGLHKQMIVSVLPLIFKDKLPEYIDLLKEIYEFDHINHEIFVIAPRRYGKTIMIAMFVAAYIIVMPVSTTAIVFSTGQRASQSMLRLIYDFIACNEETARLIKHHSAEHLGLTGPNGCLKLCKSFPPVVKVRIEKFVNFSLLFKKLWWW